MKFNQPPNFLPGIKSGSGAGNVSKKSNWLKGAVAFTMLAAISSAHAIPDTVDWGVHDGAEFASKHVAKGSFSDIFEFMLPSFNNLASATVSDNLVVLTGPPPKTPMSVFQIDGGKVSLFQGVFGDATPDVLKLSYNFDGTTGGSTHIASGLMGGSSYYYEVTGNAVGKGGGFYSLTSALAPVPEPSTYGMLIAGLALMGFMARRRSSEA